MSKTLSSMLMKCLKWWWNVYNPLLYADETSKTLSSILMKCLNPLIYADEMSKTLSSILMKCLNPLIYDDEMSRTHLSMLRLMFLVTIHVRVRTGCSGSATVRAFTPHLNSLRQPYLLPVSLSLNSAKSHWKTTLAVCIQSLMTIIHSTYCMFLNNSR